MDFLSTVLMFDGQREADGSDGSPECAVSTLLAPAPRDQDPEEVSRTLVLVSAGNGAASPGDGQGTLGAVTPQASDELDRGTLAFILRPGVATATGGRSSSPPLAKVERTFVHIAETTHRIVMTTGKQIQRDEREKETKEEEEDKEEVLKKEEKEQSLAEEKRSSKDEIVWEKVVQEKEEEQNKEQEEQMYEEQEEREKQEEVQQEEKNVKDEAKKKKDFKEKDEEAPSPSKRERCDLDQDEENEALCPSRKPQDHEASPESPDLRPPETPVECKEAPPTDQQVIAEPKTFPPEELQHQSDSPSPAPDYEVTPQRVDQARPRRRSRIPVLISEEETGSDQSSQASPRQSPRTRRTQQPQLARLILERKRSTQSTTASEDDTQQSDEPVRARPGERAASRSRIPRPVTPIKRPIVRTGSPMLPQTQRSVSFIQARSVNVSKLNVCLVGQKVGS